MQVVCLHGVEFKKHGLNFLRVWCKNSEMVLALENSGVRKKITNAIIEEKSKGDPIISKILLPKDSLLERIFEVDCTRGFYAIAFALQAKKRLSLRRPVRCIGYGRKGHEGCPHWPIGHGHDEEMLLWIDMWREGSELSHLEWDTCAEELLGALKKKKFIEQSVRMESANISAAQMVTTLETGLANVEDIFQLASRSKYYKDILYNLYYIILYYIILYYIILYYIILYYIIL